MFGGAGLNGLCEYLNVNTTLKSLDVSTCGNDSYVYITLSLLFSYIYKQTKNCKIKGIGFADDDVKWTFDGRNAAQWSLATLSLANNFCTPEWIRNLVSFLQFNRSITCLDLSHCYLVMCLLLLLLLLFVDVVDGL
jgi:hypothetical protein